MIIVEVFASGGIKATLFSLIGISLNSNISKTVTVSADGITAEGLTSPYRNINTGGRCDLSNIQDPAYVRIAYKAKLIKYTVNTEAGVEAEFDACKAVANIGAGASANVKANYKTNFNTYRLPMPFSLRYCRIRFHLAGETM
jgi:hypothetical protein